MTDELLIPRHLGLILDGNRRWARSKNLITFAGHQKGYAILKDISKLAFDKGIKYVSAYIFSTENWDRTKKEVNYLMSLAYRMLTRDIEELNKENIKILWLGSSEKLSQKLINAIKKAEELTKNNTKGTLCICFNYGGQQEIADAVKKLVNKGTKADEITPELISEHLYCPEVPPIDLVIRTSGEQRVSGFMLWRIAYSELYFISKHWPDFTEKDLDEALDSYVNRERRFGQ